MDASCQQEDDWDFLDGFSTVDIVLKMVNQKKRHVVIVSFKRQRLEHPGPR